MFTWYIIPWNSTKEMCNVISNLSVLFLGSKNKLGQSIHSYEIYVNMGVLAPFQSNTNDQIVNVLGLATHVFYSLVL